MAQNVNSVTALAEAKAEKAPAKTPFFNSLTEYWWTLVEKINKAGLLTDRSKSNVISIKSKKTTNLVD